MYEDVQTLTAERLRADGIGPIDLVCGSPPCQDASTANTSGKGIEGARTGLYLDAVRIVLDIRPRWFSFENVPGIRNRGIDRVLDLLEAGGYACWPLVVGAADLGAPHLRKRSIVIGADAATVQRLAQSWDQPDQNSERAIANNEGNGWGSRLPGRLDPSPAREQGKLDASFANTKSSSGRTGFCQDGQISDGPVADNCASPPPRGTKDARQSRGAGLEIECGESSHNGPELTALERAITARCGARAENWNGGIAGRFILDDGVPKGMAQPLLAAYGDAFAPQAAEVVGRAIIAAEKAIAETKKV